MGALGRHRRTIGGYSRFVWSGHGGHDDGGRLPAGLRRLLPPTEASYLPGTCLIFLNQTSTRLIAISSYIAICALDRAVPSGARGVLDLR